MILVDTLIIASAFLQSLSYGLDFEDKLMLTDHRGADQGSLSIVLTPCKKNGTPLGDDYFVDDPKELLDKGPVINRKTFNQIINSSLSFEVCLKPLNFEWPVTEYYVKVDVRAADINNTRFMHGLYVQYGCGFLDEKKVSKLTLNFF